MFTATPADESQLELARELCAHANWEAGIPAGDPSAIVPVGNVADAFGYKWFDVVDSSSFPYRGWITANEEGDGFYLEEDLEGALEDDPRIAAAEWERG